MCWMTRTYPSLRGKKGQKRNAKNDGGKGVSKEDEKRAASDREGNDKVKEDQKREHESEDEHLEDPDDEAEIVGRRDISDPHAKEEQVLELPEEMQLDGQDKRDPDSDSALDDGM